MVAFATTAKIVELSKDSGIIQNMETIKNTDVGGATYVEEALKLLEQNDYVPDRILLFSDMQVYSENLSDAVVLLRRFFYFIVQWVKFPHIQMMYFKRLHLEVGKKVPPVN